jgi:hypothetical protein
MEGLPEEEPRPEHTTRDRHRGERGHRSGGRGRSRKNGNGHDNHANGAALTVSPVVTAAQMPVEAKPVPHPQAVKTHEPRQQRTSRNESHAEKPNGKPNGQAPRPPKANGHDASQLPAFILRPVRLPPKTVKTP